jgi:two-component system response regulator DesR
MVRTLLVLDGGLVRGALAHVLTAEGDIAVVGEVGSEPDLHAALRAERPDVAVVDLRVVGVDRLPGVAAALAGHGGGRMLVLVDPHRAARLGPVLAEHGRRIGFLSRNVAPRQVVDAVRRLAAGQIVLDAELVAASLRRTDSPLTPREVEVLDVAAEGHPVREIAAKLVLSAGTVRNHLSRIMTKTGARTRLEAVQIARRSGWI